MSSDVHDPKQSDLTAATTAAQGASVLPGNDHQHDSSQTAVGLPPFLMSMEGDWQSDKTVISTRPPVLPDEMPRTSASLGEMLVGASLDHYQLVEFVGGGGMGAVFRSLDTRLGRTVAVKVLSRDHNDEETIRRFRNEAQSAARLDHPNIARVHYVGEASGFNYIVFEFIEGTNARDIVLKSGPLSIPDCLRLAYKLAEALDHASQREVVHRDIKPSNILITADGQVKLVDMGLARLHMNAGEDDLTESGVTLGTFDYISPEQARDPRLADVRSDIYSLGCTLFFLLSGQPPFPEGTALQKLLKHNGDEPPDLRDFRDDLSDRVLRIVQKMLAKKPTQRFQTAAELAAEVAKAADELGVTLDTPQLALAHPQTDRWQPLLTSIAISGPIALMLVLWFMLDWFLPTTQADMKPFQPRLEPAIAAVVPGPNIEKPEVPVKPEKVTPSPGENNTTEKPIENPQPMPPDPTIPAVKPMPEGTGTTESPATLSTPMITKPMPPTPASPREGTPTPPRRAFTKVIVRRTASPSEGIVDQLAAAVKLATEKNLAEIELQIDGPMYERPLTIGNKELTIRAGDGFHPVVVFRPDTNLNDEQRMVRIDGNSVAAVRIQDVEFRLELPQQTSSLSWSLFALGQVRSLSLDDCLLTIVNSASSGGGTLHYPVAFFELLPPRMTDMMMDGRAMMPTTTLHLGRSIVRGEATLVSMQEEVPFDFNWQEGVLAISEPVLSSQGATVKHKGFGRIDLRFKNVSAFAGGGMYQLRRRDEAAFQLDLNIVCDDCLLRWGREASLFDLHNGPQLADVRLQFDGLNNSYEAPDRTFLRVRPKAAAASEFSLENRREWSSDKTEHFDITVPRDAEAPMLPLHQWLTRELTVNNDGEFLGVGCDPTHLPEPYVTPAEVKPDAPKEEDSEGE